MTLTDVASTAVGLALRAAIRVYQWVLAPVLGSNCRFVPSCSEYAREAIAVHGPLAGVALGLRRILRCNPWGGAGWDPVPSKRGAACHHSAHGPECRPSA
ncbi:MAG TPA: membrane protein insertion efficiency factor YidD [Alphaproteobacteria bacterium]|nr:membrane protein insertion efficiency factor YidD [Alphaproteobacteria bacterium]